jgi:hypothetical protein
MKAALVAALVTGNSTVVALLLPVVLVILAVMTVVEANH